MKLTDEVKALRARMLTEFPPPLDMPAGAAKEEFFRDWCIDFAEQVAFSVPGQGYGVKRAEPTRPISKDTLAQQGPETLGRLLIWDLFAGVGTSVTKVVADPDSQDVTGQVFEAVIPTDHLGGAGPEPPEPPIPPVEPGSCPCKKELEALQAELDRIYDEVQSLAAGQTITHNLCLEIWDLLNTGQWHSYVSGWMGKLAGLVGPRTRPPGR